MGKRKKISDPPKDASTSTNNVGSAQPTGTGSGSAEQQTRKQDNSAEASVKSNDSGAATKWSGGSWRGKANAVAEMTKESISSVSAAAQAVPFMPESHQSKDPTGSPSERLSRTLRAPSKSSPSAASMTRLSVSSNRQVDPEASKEAKNTLADTENKGTNSTDVKEESKEDTSAVEETSKDRPLPASGWRGWWSRPRSEGIQDEKTEDILPKASSGPVDVPQQNISQVPTAATSKSVPKSTLAADAPQDGKQEESKGETASLAETNQGQSQYQRSSWLGLWSSGQGPAAGSGSTATSPKAAPAEPTQTDPEPASNADVKNNKAVTTIEEPKTSDQPPTSGSWAFWSRETPKKDSAKTSKDEKADPAQEERGELAIAHTTSQDKPKPAQMKEPAPQSGSSTPKSNKRERPVSEEAVKEKLEASSLDKTSTTDPQAKGALVSKDGADTPEKAQKAGSEKSVKKSKSSSPRNLLLPEFRNTYHLFQTPSYWQQIIRMFGRTAQTQEKHLGLATSSPKVQNAIAIGVHGYFPAPFVQRVIGQPTGTSIRFANGAAAAIQKWSEEHGQNCDVQKVALEGEGMVSDRLDTLWKLLLNWIDQIRKADFIMIACHSQGVPVGIMLLARLIEFGCISNGARLGVCGMAGVNLGPFTQYQSRFFGTSSAGELFDFSRSHSSVSQRYQSALSTVLKHHVRIVFVGSIDDQLVSLESSTFSNIAHPYIYRAVFVDGRIHAPDFLTRLVGFALKLRNLGISDHGLIRELSSPLAGSLYTGEGHSRIYEDSTVYELAVQHALETTTLTADMPLDVKPYEVPATNNTNPYFLPWAMRGLLEEEFVKTELKDETSELLRLFEGWQPTSKVLKDVKFRLEAVKSKL